MLRRWRPLGQVTPRALEYRFLPVVVVRFRSRRGDVSSPLRRTRARPPCRRRGSSSIARRWRTSTGRMVATPRCGVEDRPRACPCRLRGGCPRPSGLRRGQMRPRGLAPARPGRPQHIAVRASHDARCRGTSRRQKRASAKGRAYARAAPHDRDSASVSAHRHAHPRFAPVLDAALRQGLGSRRGVRE